MYSVTTYSYSCDEIQHESQKFFQLEENALLYYNAVIARCPIDENHKVFIRKINTEDDNMEKTLSDVEKFGY